MLDKNFGGRLPAAVVREEILSNLLHNGWSAECVEVVVIDPELEVWLWQRGNPHVARAFRYNGSVSLEAFLEAEGFWSAAALKPARPKEAARLLLRRYRGWRPDGCLRPYHREHLGQRLSGSGIQPSCECFAALVSLSCRNLEQ